VPVAVLVRAGADPVNARAASSTQQKSSRLPEVTATSSMSLPCKQPNAVRTRASPWPQHLLGDWVRGDACALRTASGHTDVALPLPHVCDDASLASQSWRRALIHAPCATAALHNTLHTARRFDTSPTLFLKPEAETEPETERTHRHIHRERERRMR